MQKNKYVCRDSIIETVQIYTYHRDFIPSVRHKLLLDAVRNACPEEESFTVPVKRNIRIHGDLCRGLAQELAVPDEHILKELLFYLFHDNQKHRVNRKAFTLVLFLLLGSDRVDMKKADEFARLHFPDRYYEIPHGDKDAGLRTQRTRFGWAGAKYSFLQTGI